MQTWLKTKQDATKNILTPRIQSIESRDVIHIANTNHRTCREDFDVLIREVVRLGQILSQSVPAE